MAIADKKETPAPKVSRMHVPGDTCQYLPPGSPVWCAAIMTSCEADGRASLYVLRHDFGGADWVYNAPHGDTAGHWRSLNEGRDAEVMARTAARDEKAAA